MFLGFQCFFLFPFGLKRAKWKEKKPSKIYCSTQEYSFHMFIYACIFREYNDMIPPSLSLHMKGIFILLHPLYICVYNQWYFWIVLCFAFGEEKSIFYTRLFIKEKKWKKQKIFQNKTRNFLVFRIFNDACVQVQLEISCLRLFVAFKASCNTIHSSGSKIIYCIFTHRLGYFSFEVKFFISLLLLRFHLHLFLLCRFEDNLCDRIWACE